MQVRDRCGSGDYKSSKLKLRKGSKPEDKRFPQPSCNYVSTHHPISSDKAKDMNTMYSWFISRDKWPDYVSGCIDSQPDEPPEHHTPPRRYMTRSVTSRGQ